MRDYKGKMDKYRISDGRYEALREYCLNAGERDEKYIREALSHTCNDALASYIYRHVTTRGYGLERMQADRMPCNADTFRLYRARFFWNLDRIIRRERGDIYAAYIPGRPEGGAPDGV